MRLGRVNSLDCHVLGLTMSIVGVVAFANTIVFRRPRAAIEDFFGESRPSLRTVKDLVLRKIHTYLGLGFLLAGFLMQIVAVLPIFARGERPSGFLPFAIAGVLVLATLLELVGGHYSRRSFRRHLKRFFRAHPEYPFERNVELAKEIGRTFRLESSPDETVDGYLLRLRQRIGVESAGARPERARAEKAR